MPEAVQIDIEKFDLDLVRQNLEIHTDGVLSLYDYLLQKGIIQPD